MEYWQTKWVWEKPSRPLQCLPLWPVIKALGDHISSLFQPPSSWTGRWSSKGGVLASRYLPISGTKRNEESRDTAGAKRTHFTFALLRTSLWSRIILLSEERSGTIWCLMRRRTSRISKVKDGKRFSASTLKGDFSWLVHPCRMMWWSSGHSCISWCRTSSPTSRISKSGSPILSPNL